VTTNSPTSLRSKKEIIKFLQSKDRHELTELLKLAATGAREHYNHFADQKERDYYRHVESTLRKFLGDA
jgi:hypothetical protein